MNQQNFQTTSARRNISHLAPHEENSIRPQHKPIFHHATKPGINVIKSSDSISNNVLAGENIADFDSGGSENIHEKTTLYEDENMIINIRYPKPTDQQDNNGGESDNAIIKDHVPMGHYPEGNNLQEETYEQNVAEIPIWDKKATDMDKKMHNLFETVEYIEDFFDIEEYDGEDNLYSESNINPMMYEPTDYNVIENKLENYPMNETPVPQPQKENRIGFTRSEDRASPNPDNPQRSETFTLKNDPDKVLYERIHNPQVRFDIDPLSQHSGVSFDPLSQHKPIGVRSADLISDELMRKHQRREVLKQRINPE